MAAATAIGLGGLALSAFQAIDGSNRAKSAQNKLNNYERQELNNAFENVQISTMGSDLLREENARTSASLTNSAQMGGARTIIGGIPKIVSSTNTINQQAAKMLDDQVRQREYAIAQDNARIEGITENRDIANISALSSQIDAGRQDMWSGINSGLTSAAYMGRGLTGGGEAKTANPEQTSVQSLGIKPIESNTESLIQSSNNKLLFNSPLNNVPKVTNSVNMPNIQDMFSSNQYHSGVYNPYSNPRF